MTTVTIPQKAYKELIKKAQLFERFRSAFRDEYPIEDYSDKRIKEFEREDKVSQRAKKSFSFLLKI